LFLPKDFFGIVSTGIFTRVKKNLGQELLALETLVTKNWFYALTPLVLASGGGMFWKCHVACHEV